MCVQIASFPPTSHTVYTECRIHNALSLTVMVASRGQDVISGITARGSGSTERSGCIPLTSTHYMHTRHAETCLEVFQLLSTQLQEVSSTDAVGLELWDVARQSLIQTCVAKLT